MIDTLAVQPYAALERPTVHVEGSGRPAVAEKDEKVAADAPTGPAPAFKHTYLEQMSALWPKDPETAKPKAEPEPRQATGYAPDAERTTPTVDVRR